MVKLCISYLDIVFEGKLPKRDNVTGWGTVPCLPSNTGVNLFGKLTIICLLQIYTTVGGLSSKFDEFLAVRSQFDSDHGVDFYAPTCCQSATFARPLFAFNCPLYFTRKKMWHFATDAMFTLRD